MKKISQSEAAECGLACLPMVASAHGMLVGLPEMRRRFSLSLRGAKLNQLIRIARMGSAQTIQRTLTTSFVEALIDGLMAVVAFALMLVYSWKLALVTVLAVALYPGIRAIAYRPVRDRTEQQLVAAARQQSHLLEGPSSLRRKYAQEEC